MNVHSTPYSTAERAAPWTEWIDGYLGGSDNDEHSSTSEEEQPQEVMNPHNQDDQKLQRQNPIPRSPVNATEETQQLIKEKHWSVLPIEPSLTLTNYDQTAYGWKEIR